MNFIRNESRRFLNGVNVRLRLQLSLFNPNFLRYAAILTICGLSVQGCCLYVSLLTVSWLRNIRWRRSGSTYQRLVVLVFLSHLLKSMLLMFIRCHLKLFRIVSRHHPNLALPWRSIRIAIGLWLTRFPQCTNSPIPCIQLSHHNLLPIPHCYSRVFLWIRWLTLWYLLAAHLLLLISIGNFRCILLMQDCGDLRSHLRRLDWQGHVIDTHSIQMLLLDVIKYHLVAKGRLLQLLLWLNIWLLNLLLRLRLPIDHYFIWVVLLLHQCIVKLSDTRHLLANL